ncbi:MAG TPA: FAD-binding oxidoreductase [Gaiellaceae bacterium]
MTTIVVGGGIIGATTTWELARAGEAVLLLEAGEIAGESTGKSAAIVRTHYSNPEVVRMAVRSREAFMRAPELLGCEPFYDRRGWLFLVDETDAPLARGNRRMQLAEGAHSDEVDPTDFLDGVSTEAIAYALFEPDSGFADPVAATRAYVDAARRAGAGVREGASVDAVEPGCGVCVDGELLEADNVVLAAGAWTSKLTAPLGLELPLETPREQEVVFEGTVEHAVSSQVDRVYLRPDGEGRIVVGRGYPKTYEPVDPDGYDEGLDPGFEADVAGRVAHRLPRLAGARAVGGLAGLYEVTPDWHPILGAADGHDGLYLATGGSGHCFKLAPAIGELVAGQILGRPVDYADVHSFSLSRFAEGREFRSTYGGNRA